MLNKATGLIARHFTAIYDSFYSENPLTAIDMVDTMFKNAGLSALPSSYKSHSYEH